MFKDDIFGHPLLLCSFFHADFTDLEGWHLAKSYKAISVIRDKSG
jgi:hypothetical protein